MKIERLELTHFGRFHHKTVEFTSGLNVVFGRNEAGKTTIQTFIRAMLFDLPDTGDTAQLYRRYLPWDTPDAYCGVLWLTRGGVTYRIERSFLKGNKSLRLFDETDGRELKPAAKNLKEILGGLTEAGYLETICIGQMKGSDNPELAGEVEELLEQACQSRNVNINVQEASRSLIERRNELRRSMVPADGRKTDEVTRQLADTRIRLSRIQQAKSVQEELARRYGERAKNVSGENDERLMEYERERDALRRQYEAARNAYDEAPRVDERRTRGIGISWLVFLLLAILSTAGGIAVYLYTGLETKTELALLVCLCCLAFVFVAASLLSVAGGQRRKQKAIQAKELEKRLERNYLKSYRAFEECRRRAPKDEAEMVRELTDKSRNAAAEAEGLEKKLKVEEERERGLEKEYDRLLEESRQNEEVKTELEAVAMAYRTMNRLSERIHDTFGNLLLTEASRLLAKVTAGKYDKIYVDGRKKVFLVSDGQEIPLESVSRGTIEQVYLCIRVAAAGLIWQDEEMPFVFDDVFACYDDMRLEAAMRMLKESGRQCIIFSCRTRENSAI